MVFNFSLFSTLGNSKTAILNILIKETYYLVPDVPTGWSILDDSANKTFQIAL